MSEPENAPEGAPVAATDEVPEAAPGAAPKVTPEARLRMRVALVMAGSDVTQSRLAQDVGFSQAVVSRWLRGVYVGDSATLNAKFESWLNNRAARRGSPAQPTEPQWVPTPTGLRIESALEFAYTRRKIALVYGGAGVGKSTALHRFAQEVRSAWIITANPAMLTPSAVLRTICNAMGLYVLQANTVNMMDAIKQRTFWGNSGRVLIVDEAQHLSLPALEQLRYIHDAYAIGLVLSGNEEVYSKLTGGARHASFAQLFSRVGRRLRVSVPSEGDIAAILDAWRITGQAERAYAAQIAMQPGGLRELFNLLEEASYAASGLDKALDVSVLRMARAELAGKA